MKNHLGLTAQWDAAWQARVDKIVITADIPIADLLLGLIDCDPRTLRPGPWHSCDVLYNYCLEYAEQHPVRHRQYEPNEIEGKRDRFDFEDGSCLVIYPTFYALGIDGCDCACVYNRHTCED